tara:strand:+ start:149 stop:298 length:150 start_codon:yes stop_codon:yes gene_type:complete
MTNIKKHLKNRISAMEHNLAVAKKNKQFSLIKELIEEITKVKKVLKESA